MKDVEQDTKDVTAPQQAAAVLDSAKSNIGSKLQKIVGLMEARMAERCVFLADSHISKGFSNG